MTTADAGSPVGLNHPPESAIDNRPVQSPLRAPPSLRARPGVLSSPTHRGECGESACIAKHEFICGGVIDSVAEIGAMARCVITDGWECSIV